MTQEEAAARGFCPQFDPKILTKIAIASPSFSEGAFLSGRRLTRVRMSEMSENLTRAPSFMGSENSENPAFIPSVSVGVRRGVNTAQSSRQSDAR